MNKHEKKLLIKRSVILLLSFCLLAFSILPFTLAWLHVGELPISFSGEVMWGYFASGDGSVASPFTITKPIHLYNFAWLQYQGVLDDLAGGISPHVQIDPSLTELDMAGTWDANEWISGAIPPIGTTASPFTGTFNGNGVIIKNLWVSTDPNDWKERPANLNATTLGTDVGLFGYVDKTAKIGNFYLQNIEVTNTINTAGVNLGILAGYVDGEIQNVGIKNAKLSFHSGKAAQATSDFALIGKITTSVFWEEQPGGGHYNDPLYAGGDLQINPSADNFSFSLDTTKTSVDGGQKERVKEGVDAYYVGSLSLKAPKPEPSASSTYIYQDILEFTDNQDVDSCLSTKSGSYQLTSSSCPQDIKDEYNQIFQSSSDVKGIDPGADPVFSQTQGNTSTPLEYPSNTIWFKPIADGEAALAFSKQSSNANDIMSIYRFKRITDENNANYGKIDPTTVQEFVCILNNGKKNDGFGNGTIIGFRLKVDAGYEYAIGSTTTTSQSGNDAYFVYLKLGGTDNVGGKIPDGQAPDGGDYRILKKIDFVKDFLTPDATTHQIDWSQMIQHQSRFMITGGSHDGSAETGIYFDVIEVTGDGDPYEAVLYYNTSGFTLTQQFVGGKEYKEADDADDFTTRDSPTGNSP